MAGDGADFARIAGFIEIFQIGFGANWISKWKF